MIKACIFRCPDWGLRWGERRMDVGVQKKQEIGFVSIAYSSGRLQMATGPAQQLAKSSILEKPALSI